MSLKFSHGVLWMTQCEKIGINKRTANVILINNQLLSAKETKKH